MKIHINMSLSELTSHQLLQFLSGRGIRPELFIDGNEIERLTEGELEKTGETLSSFNLLPLSVHAPFEDLSPGSSDGTIRSVTLDKITKAVDIARFMPVEGIVVHSGYSDWHFDYNVDRWLSNAIPTFSEICERAESLKTRIFVENIFETTPDNLLSLKENLGADNLGFCFDPGHAALFSQKPLVTWIKHLGNHIEEVHLHDNSGKRDEHLPLLEGNINFRGVLTAIKDTGKTPLFTLEPHTIEHAKRTLHNFNRLVSEIYGEQYEGIF